METTNPGTVSSLAIPVLEGPQLKSGIRLISGFIPAGVLILENYKIPYRDSLKKTGYQRKPQSVRINELAQDLRQKRVDLPTAILLNIRDPSAGDAVQETLAGKVLELSSWSTIPRDPGAFFFVVDGQHRVLAMEKLLTEDRDRWANFPLPFVCMIGANENEEMDQFYVVNSKAKSVRTDLAYELLKARSDRDSNVYTGLVERGREWQVDGQAVVERLADSSAIWKRRIRLPSMDKGETTITNTSLVNSMKPLLNDSPFFKRSSVDQRLKVLEAYWEGIRAAIPQAFEEPGAYSIQKGLGVMVLHEIMPDVIELVRSKGGSVLEKEAYQAILEPTLEKLEGDNANGDVVIGADFWRAAPDGAAGSFSSSAGRRVLTAKIRQLLPTLDAE
jgi:DGQHR domain-containing protein